jgi:hypothetical protein
MTTFEDLSPPDVAHPSPDVTISQNSQTGAAAPSPSPAAIIRVLTNADYERAAAAIGCDIRVIRAAASVESSGSGFLPAPDTRPTILFEAAKFCSHTGGRFAGRRDRHGVLLSSPTWNASLYGATGEHQWERHADAAALDPVAADLSCSWGTFQIMGENFGMCGHPSVEDFASAMRSGAGAQLEAYVAFIKSDGLVSAMIHRDWTTIARKYNGPGQVNEYAEKMAAAYVRLANV